MDKEILRLEELAINAFPALSTEIYDGWILRYSNGYTYRGNSINPLYSSIIDLEDKIEYCENKYFEKGLPCVYKMTENVEKDLDMRLQNKGYAFEKSSYIMGHKADKEDESIIEDVSISMNITDEWLSGFLDINEVMEENARLTAKTMLTNIKNPVLCARIDDGEKMIACGLGVLEDGKIGLYDICVMEQYRRKGYATKVCKAIINQGIINGADSAYLQVASSNEKALKLYASIGFKRIYTYWYRVKNSRSLD